MELVNANRACNICLTLAQFRNNVNDLKFVSLAFILIGNSWKASSHHHFISNAVFFLECDPLNLEQIKILIKWSLKSGKIK